MIYKTVFTVRYVVVLVLMLVCASCSENNSDSFAQSGHADLDQTAQFAHHLIELVKKRTGMNSPSSVVNYINSTSGSAELWPPNPEYEPDAAAHYKGPRPANGVGLSGGPAKQGVFEREIVMIADDSNNRVIAQAYVSGQSTPVYVWTWNFH